MGVPTHHNQWYLRDLACMYAKGFLGSKYEWGGENPWGFDCSGFISEVLSGVGIEAPRDRTTSIEYSKRYPVFWEPSQERNLTAEKGCLVCYGRGKISHIMLAISPNHVIGASGGGSQTDTAQEADDKNAFVKLRPIDYRSDALIVVDPFRITEE